MSDLDAQMAAINPVKSAEIVSMAKTNADLNRVSNEIISSANRVAAVKQILEDKQDYEITPDMAQEIDSTLMSVNALTVENGEVVYQSLEAPVTIAGVEELGLTMRASEYRMTRIAACEGYLDGAIERVKVFTAKLVQNFHDTYVLTVEDTSSLIARFRAVEREAAKYGTFKDGLEKFQISSRLFNLLKVNNEVKENWRDQILNLYKSSSALTSNYYAYAEAELTEIMAYFANFEGTVGDEIIPKMLGVSRLINYPSFRECKIPVTAGQSSWLKVNRSVELMGGRYLLDTRYKEPVKIESVHSIDDWFDSRIDTIGVKFNKRDYDEYVDQVAEIDTFGSDTIRHICALAIKSLEAWLTICQKANRHRIGERDYERIGDMLEKLDIPGEHKSRVLAMYTMLVRRNQQELLTIVADFTRYQIIALNSLASLCNDSINYIKDTKSGS